MTIQANGVEGADELTTIDWDGASNGAERGGRKSIPKRRKEKKGTCARMEQLEDGLVTSDPTLLRRPECLTAPI